ncbi:MAG: phosphotransferase family protein [Pseudonocardiales bacterium]
MSGHSLACDDVVGTFEEAAGHSREPLLVLEPLAAFLDAHGLGSGGEITVEPIGEGHSNITFLLRRDGVDRDGVGREAVECVLRRPPRGPLPPSAHDVLREARVLRALGPTPVRVPAVLAVCDDLEVIGAPFYLMEKVEGHVVTSAIPAELDSVAQRRRIGEELIDALVEVHAVDWQAVGLAGFGKPTGYLQRQVRRFLGLWEHNKTRELAAVERVGRWLAVNLPTSGPATIVHGDYRLGNTMLAPGAPARIAAIFDWEMTTIGDPLADLGYLCALWADRDDPPAGMFELNSVTRAAGFPSRAELVARYEEHSGRSMTDIRWYQTLALWKAIVFMEGNYKRAMAGATDDPFLKQFRDGVVELAHRAEQMAYGAR